MQTGLRKIAVAGMLIHALVITGITAQVRFGITAGASPGVVPDHKGVIINRETPAEEFFFNIAKINPQLYIGASARMEIPRSFFIESGLQYSQRKSTYAVTYTIIDAEHPVSNHALAHTAHFILLPVNAGVSLGQVEITSGVRAYHTWAGESALNQLSAFANHPVFAKLGWQAGVGVRTGRTRIGIEYISDFARMGSDMSVNGQSLELRNVHGQFAVNVHQSF